MEQDMPSAASHCPYFDEVVLMRDTGVISHMHKVFFQYKLQEALRACRALLVQYMYNNYKAENLIVYMDAETMVLSPLDELIAAAQAHPIVLTGHVIDPEALNMDDLAGIRKSGSYHPGLIAFGRHPVAERYIAAWSKLSERGCYLDANQTSYADQPWLDLAHSLFEDVYALRHPGYAVGPGNLMERWNIRQGPNQAYFIDDRPLRSLHFAHGFELAATWIDSDKGQIYSDLFYEYSKAVVNIGSGGLDHTPWSYGRYTSGEVITDQAKKMFRLHYFDNPEIDSPFGLSNIFFHANELVEQERYSLEPDKKIASKSSRGMRAKKRRIGRKKLSSTRKKRSRSYL
ncbi:hypothetical protein [Paenibacillus luteus]|uniref:hypothetical protein n=1 Tax=Paenibacillus luteus TaxID=2545753 RepID=UPI0019D5BE1C|nr:hypothetical protein [Paenibacillus luteus]